MKRHTSRILPTALAAVLVLGACGGTDDDAAPDPPAEQPSDGDLRAPTPIEFTSGGADGRIAAPASAESAIAADDMMIAPYFDIEYLLGDGLVAPTDDTGYVYDAGGEVTADQVARLAAVFGVEGEPVRTDDGYTVSWRVGTEDGTAPSLWVSDDAQQWWNYSSAWADQGMVREACAVTIDREGNERVEECPEPEPPVGVPSAEEAEQRARELLTALGVDPAAVEFDTYADEWFTSVTANSTADARAPLATWNFGFGGEGVLQYAGGSLATPVPVGPYPLIDIETAFQRLQDQSYGGSISGGFDSPAIASVEVAAEPPPEPGEPTIEPLPADDVMVDPPIDGTVPEPETITVTLVDVQADLWWAWDVDGTVWLLPAYRFIGDDDGWYTVPAVTDEYLVQVDPPVVEEPMPVEPDGGPGDSGGVTEPGEPVAPVPTDPAVPAEELAGLVGAPLADFTAEAEGAGWTVRVVEIDGEQLMVTEDFRIDRINVAVVTVDGVEQVVRATLDDGTLVGEATIAPTEQAPVPVVDVDAGVAFYPACGNEMLAHEGVTWYQVNEGEYPEEYAAAVGAAREAAPAAAGVNGFARVVAPGPGDDVGTLVVWADGVARFVSDSGDLTAWLIDDELTYDWVC